MEWNVDTRTRNIPESDLPALQQKAVDLLDLLQKNLLDKAGEKAKWNFEKAHSILHKVLRLCCGVSRTTPHVKRLRYIPVRTSMY